MLYDIGAAGDTDYLVMEYLDGRSLAAHLAQGPLPLDEALGYVEAAVAAGLTQREWLEHDSNLDAIRSTPRFQTVMVRL